MNEMKLPFDFIGQRVADSEVAPNNVFLGETIYTRPKSMTDLFRNITPETKTKLVSIDGRLIAGVYDKGVIVRTANIIPDIVDVKVIKEHDEPKVIKVTFDDNSVEKAVLDKNDTYSLEQGISICITKRILSVVLSVNAVVGGSIYNKLISRAIDVMENNEKEAEKREKELADEKAKMEKIVAKKKQRAEQRAAKQREYYINAHAEAYVRAMKKIREEDKAELNQPLDEVADEFGKFLNNLLEQ